MSATVLADNAKRLLRATPKDAKQSIKQAIPPSTMRTITKSLKSATLRTVDDLAAIFDAPAWMLIHPDMKRWDQNRKWIDHLIRAYLGASPDGQELLQRTALAIEQMSSMTKIKVKKSSEGETA